MVPSEPPLSPEPPACGVTWPEIFPESSTDLIPSLATLPERSTLAPSAISFEDLPESYRRLPEIAARLEKALERVRASSAPPGSRTQNTCRMCMGEGDAAAGGEEVGPAKGFQASLEKPVIRGGA